MSLLLHIKRVIFKTKLYLVFAKKGYSPWKIYLEMSSMDTYSFYFESLSYTSTMQLSSMLQIHRINQEVIEVIQEGFISATVVVKM